MDTISAGGGDRAGVVEAAAIASQKDAVIAGGSASAMRDLTEVDDGPDATENGLAAGAVADCAGGGEASGEL